MNLLMRVLGYSKGRVVHVEELIEWKVPTGLGRIKAFLAHDLVVRAPNSNDSCTILDWKTGKESDEAGDQLDFYAAWGVANGWRHIDTALVYLGDGQVVTKWDTPDLDEATARVSRRVGDYGIRLREKLVNHDIIRNEPVEVAFVPTTDAWKCRDCPFADLCERDGTKPKPT